MMPRTGREVDFVPADRMRVRFLVLLGFALVVCFASIGAWAQTIAPPSMTFACTPDPIYSGASATCTASVGGGATGSVSMYLGTLLLTTVPLDSNGNAVATTSAFGPGPGIYVITGVYSGDSQYQSTQRDMALTVYSGQVMITSETLVCSPYIDFNGNPTSCKMHLPGGATGTVNFTIAGNAWATATVDQNGDAIVANGLQGAAVGDYRITATYSGDTNFGPATASTTAVVIPFKPEPNSMSVGCSPSPLVVGNTGSCTVRVGGGVTGSVDLYVHDQYLTTVQLDGSGTATIPNVFGSLPAGSYSVRAVYTGDANFDTASAATTININTGTQAPTLTIVCNPTALSPGSGTNCTAQASPGATGQISFYVAGNYWATVSVDGNGQAMATSGLSNLPVGSYSVVAYYPGDQNFTSTSAGITVPIQTTKPVPNISVSCSPTALMSGNVTTCTSSVDQGATGPVLFGLPGQPTSGLTLDPNGNVVFQNQLAGVSVGSYTLQASYQGDINFAPASATTTITVSSQQSTPVMTPSVTPTVIRSGDTVRVAVNVSGGATGSVELLVNGAHYVTMPLDSGGSFVGAAHVTPSPQNGSWYLGFNYSGDANYLPVTQTVQLTAITNPLTLSCSPNTISTGGSTSCTAQVVGVTTGTISLYLDGALQGTNGVDQSGSVVIAVPATSLSPGSHTVTASYFLDDQSLSGTAATSISVTSGSTQSGYSYSITDSSGNSGYAPNGNIVAYSDSVNGQWSLGYDGLNRLTSAGTAGQNNCWVYDSFGNRTAQGIQSMACPVAGSPIPSTWTQMAGSAGNQLLGTLDSNNNIVPLYSYDPAGNMTTVQGDANIMSAVLYDGEGRVCATRQPILAGLYRQTQYVYDAEGNRVAEGMIGDWSKGCDLTQNGFQQTKAFIVGPSGEQMTELSVDTNENVSWVHTNVYAKNTLIATYTNDNGGTTPQTGLLHFVLSDWLGTKRVQTSYDGTTESAWANLPFGDGLEQNCTNCSGGDASEQHFTGKERDTESGLDYFGARYYASNMGRWMSPDWAAKTQPVPYARLDNPQSLNLYAYVANNPLSRIDPDGHYECSGSKEQCAQIQTALNLAKGAVKNLGADSKEGKAIQKVIDFYGDAGKKNGVNVSFGSFKNPAQTGEASMGKDGSVNIKFDLAHINADGSHSSQPGASMFGERVGTVVHEGTHGVDERRWGHNPQTDQQEDWTEHNAYRNESYAVTGLGWFSASGQFYPGMSNKDREAAIDVDAKASDAAAKLP
jgi:RHS repeat-associated protein